MRRLLISGVLLLMVFSAFAYLYIPRSAIMLGAVHPPSPPPGYKPGEVVTAQQVADRLGLPLAHPVGTGEVKEILLNCWEQNVADGCQVWVYYNDGAYLTLITGAQRDRGWQERDVANDPRGITGLVDVQGQKGIGYGLSAGDETDPDGWLGSVVWFDPTKKLGFALLGPYDLDTLLSIANGPWCTLATPSGIEPPVPYC